MKTNSHHQSISHLNCNGLKGTISLSRIHEDHKGYPDIRLNLSLEGFTESRETKCIQTMVKQAIHELSACNQLDKMGQLVQIAKILELIILQVRETGAAAMPLKTVKSYDIAKFQEAKSIVENNLANPYSLKTLAHKVGLNDFKLKKGFKELFGYTVFGYLRELRMLKAKKLLLAEKDSVTQVSGEVGYLHPHHFSTAFKKRFGILPGVLCKY